MTSSGVDLARGEIWRRSLEASRARRAAAAAARRRRLRTRGGAGSLVAVVLLSCALGAGMAVGRQADRPVAQGSAVVLKVGSVGPAVAALQRKLGGLAVDGVFGPLTRRAVRRFQRRKGLLVDGIAGPQTLAALGLRLRGGARQQRASGQAGVPAVLERIARCESGGNPRAVSRDGRYRGKYQFDRATWRSLGGRGDPAAAPEAVQDRIAAELYRLRGTAPWPSCA